MRGFRNVKDESGQALTEFAVVLPILFVVIFAIVEAGVMLNNYIKLTDAVRVAARVASIQGSQGYGVASPAATSALSDAADGLTLENVAVSAQDNQWVSGQPVTVQASVHYVITLPIFGTVMAGDLTSKSIQRIE
jgi:Flp pilus assembly protein TadG